MDIINKKDLKKKIVQERVWDSVAKSHNKEALNISPIIKDFLKNKRGTILDLGCGDGRNLIFGKDLEYYCIDFSSEQLKKARSYTKKNKIKALFFKTDAYYLDNFYSSFFDYGLFIGTIHCIESKESREKALKEFYRVLKPNAEALVSIWNSEDLRFKGFEKEIYMTWKAGKSEVMRYYYLFSKKEIIELLENTGFKIIEFYETNKDKKDRFSNKNWIIGVRKI
jgi:tRNA (uracil-5-)-methyltransferase TRM9